MGLWSKFRYFLILALWASLAACSGGGAPGDGDGTVPAAPAPPAEIPSFFKFPGEIRVDTSKINPNGSPGALLAQTIGEAIDISSGPKGTGLIDRFIEVLINPISALEIPVSPDTAPLQSPISGELFENGEVILDFSDYDFDGNGTTEGCSGCTCPVGCTTDGLTTCPTQAPADELKPICIRLWAKGQQTSSAPREENFVPFLAAVLNRLPTPDDPATAENDGNSGTGAYRISDEPSNPDGPTFIGARFDQQDPLNRLAELSLFGFFDPGGTDDPFFIDLHVLESQVGEAASALKTIQVTLGESPSLTETGPTVEAYTGRFLEDQNFWSGSILTNSGIDFSAACVAISSSTSTSQGNCQDLGIDVTGLEFIDRARPEDGTLPADFPANPPLLP